MKEIFERNKKVIALLAVIYLPISGGIDFVFIDYITAYIDSVSLTFIRLVIISIIFLIVHRIKEGPLKVEGFDKVKMLITGAFGTGIYYILEAIGISMTSAALSSLILATVPLFGLMGDRIVFKNKITGQKIAGAVGSVIGVAIIILGTGGSEIKGGLAGIGVLILAALSWSVYIVMAKSLQEKYSMLTMVTCIFTCGAIVDIPVFLLGEPGNIVKLAPLHWLYIIIFAVICVAIAQLLYLYGVKELSVTTSSIVMNLLPFTAIIISWLVFEQMLTAIQLTGGIIIIAAISIASLEKSDDSKSEEKG